MSEKMEKQEQLDLAEELQGLVLRDFKNLLKEGKLTPTDRATLVRLLSANGWTLDPHTLPKNLKSMLLKDVDPLSFEDGDADLVQ